MDDPDEPRRLLERDEPWRQTHLRLLDKRLRAGGAGMSPSELALARQRHALSIPIGARYAPHVWEVTDERFQAAMAFQPTRAREAHARHQQVVVDLTLRTPFVDAQRDRTLMSVLHGVLTWAEENNYSTDPQSLLCGDRIDQYADSLELADTSRSAYRWHLRFVAACVFPPPVEAAITRTPPAQPHDDADLHRHLASISSLHRGVEETRTKRMELFHDLQAILALSYGAGCNGRAIHRVQESWLSRHDDGWWLQRPDRDVPTPILSEWGPVIESLLTGEQERWLIRPRAANERGTQVGKALAKARAFDPGLSDFDVNRAARYWQVRLLDKSHFAVLAAALGYRAANQGLGDLLPHVPEADLAVAKRLLRGWAP